METSNSNKIMEKVFIVITHYKMQDKNIGMSILNTLEDAITEAASEVSAEYTAQVEIFEADKAQYAFFGRRIFNKIKR